MTNHDDMPTRFPALVWAVILHHSAGRSGGHIRACLNSLVASRITTRRSVEAGARRAAPPTPGATQLGQRARGVVSLHLRTSHGRGV